MKFHDIQQGHIDWFRLRMGKVTASELGNLLTPEFAVRKGETPRTYLFEKLAEDWRGQPLIHTGSWATEQGNMREEEAVPWLALEKEWKIRNGGFCVSDDGLMGCSPDGLCEDFGIEVKCPEPTAHVRYLMDGIIPKQYVCQVYGSLYVTGFKRWYFLSYQRGFPPLLIEVQRDEKIMSIICEAAARFRKDFQHAKARLQWISDGGLDQDYHPKASLDTNPGEGAAKQSGAASSALCEVGIGVEQTLTTATADRTSDRSTISGAGVTGLREAVEAESRQDQAEPCNSALPSILPVPVLAELPYKSSVVEGIAHGVSPKDAKGSAQRESTPKPGPSTVIGGSRGGQNQFPVHATEPHPSASNEARRVGDFLI